MEAAYVMTFLELMDFEMEFDDEGLPVLMMGAGRRCCLCDLPIGPESCFYRSNTHRAVAHDYCVHQLLELE